MSMSSSTSGRLIGVSASSIRPPSSALCGRVRVGVRVRSNIRCEVAVEESSSSSSSSADKVGARVRVKVPLKVYHIPKVPEVDLTGMEGEIKQYVALWNAFELPQALIIKNKRKR